MNLPGVRAGEVLELQVTGRGGVPVNATTAVLNLTSTQGAGSGFVSVWPCEIPGSPAPGVSAVNFSTTDVANLVVAALTSRGTVCIQVRDGRSELLADVAGYVPG